MDLGLHPVQDLILTNHEPHTSVTHVRYEYSTNLNCVGLGAGQISPCGFICLLFLKGEGRSTMLTARVYTIHLITSLHIILLLPWTALVAAKERRKEKLCIVNRLMS